MGVADCKLYETYCSRKEYEMQEVSGSTPAEENKVNKMCNLCYAIMRS